MGVPNIGVHDLLLEVITWYIFLGLSFHPLSILWIVKIQIEHEPKPVMIPLAGKSQN